MAMVLLIGLSQLLAPAFSFLLDMRPHCLGLRQNALVPSFVLIITIALVSWELHPSDFGADWMWQKSLPMHFKLMLIWYIGIFAFVLAVSMPILRRIIARYQDAQTQSSAPVADNSTNTEDAESRQPVGRRSFDGRDIPLRKTASSDVGDWMRRTASAVTDLTSLLPAGRPSNRIAQDTDQSPV